VGLELGGGRRAKPADDSGAARLYDLIVAAVRELSLADRLRIFAAFKRGDAFADLDPVVAATFRNVRAKL
jgi:hypothetical protein